MEKNYNYNFENRKHIRSGSSKSSSSVRSAEICMAKKSDLSKEKVVNGRLYFATDSGELFIGSNDQMKPFNTSNNNSELQAAINQLKEDVALLNPDSISELSNKVDSISSDVANAQEAAAQAQAAAETLGSIKSINNVETIEGGYKIVLSDGSEITIMNGADGAPGEKGETGATGATGETGAALRFDDLTEEQKAELKGEKGDGLSDADKRKIESIPDFTFGTFPDNEKDGSEMGTPGLAMVDDVIEYVNMKLSNLEGGLDGKDGKDGTNGINGENGKSAYDIWRAAGNEGDEIAFLASLKGETGEAGAAGINGTNGTNGENGKSAYDIWRAAGHEGDETAFLASLKGETGEAGTPGVAGENGKSAYDIWRAAGNEGDETAFLASLKGEAGQDATFDFGESELNELTGAFPTGDDVEGSESFTPGFATVDDVIIYVNELFEAKKKEFEVEIKDYVYISGYPLNGTPTYAGDMQSYEIPADGVVEFIVPEDLEGYEDIGLYTRMLSIDVPEGYTFKVYQWDTYNNDGYISEEFEMVTSPISSTKTYNGVVYNCYVRAYSDLYYDCQNLGRMKIILTKTNQ